MSNSTAVRKVCIVDGCGKPQRRHSRCDSHGGRYAKFGDDNLARTWATERVCVVCGARDWPPNGRRICCSAKCFYHKQKYGGPPPELTCVLCQGAIDMTTPTKKGRKQSNTKFCSRCKRSRMLKHKASVAVLANRDGTDCGICGDPVDMALVRPNLLSPSVDHILPRSRGGSNEPGNLQLAHLYCNFVKNDRAGFTIR